MSKTELLEILSEFDTWWRENGTRLDFSDQKAQLVKPSVSDLLSWLRSQKQEGKTNGV